MESVIKTYAEEEPKPIRVIRVSDYGAKLDDGVDAVPAIREAIAAVRCLNGAPSVIQFAPGKYRCFGATLQVEGRQLELIIYAEKLENVTIDSRRSSGRANSPGHIGI